MKGESELILAGKEGIPQKSKYLRPLPDRDWNCLWPFGTRGKSGLWAQCGRRPHPPPGLGRVSWSLPSHPWLGGLFPMPRDSSKTPPSLSCIPLNTRLENCLARIYSPMIPFMQQLHDVRCLCAHYEIFL